MLGLFKQHLRVPVASQEGKGVLRAKCVNKHRWAAECWRPSRIHWHLIHQSSSTTLQEKEWGGIITWASDQARDTQGVTLNWRGRSAMLHGEQNTTTYSMTTLPSNSWVWCYNNARTIVSNTYERISYRNEYTCLHVLFAVHLFHTANTVSDHKLSSLHLYRYKIAMG